MAPSHSAPNQNVPESRAPESGHTGEALSSAAATLQDPRTPSDDRVPPPPQSETPESGCACATITDTPSMCWKDTQTTSTHTPTPTTNPRQFEGMQHSPQPPNLNQVEGMSDGWDEPTTFGWDDKGALRLFARNSGMFYLRATHESLNMVWDSLCCQI